MAKPEAAAAAGCAQAPQVYNKQQALWVSLSLAVGSNVVRWWSRRNGKQQQQQQQQRRRSSSAAGGSRRSTRPPTLLMAVAE
jgi:hypothetical protein